MLCLKKKGRRDFGEQLAYPEGNKLKQKIDLGLLPFIQ